MRGRLDNGDCGVGGEKDPTMKQEAYNTANMPNACSQARISVRALIEERIYYHNRMANDLNALLRAMPQDMSAQAENALFTLLTESRVR